MRDPPVLEVLGDGRAAKPYTSVEDVAAAALFAEREAPGRPFSTYNIANAGTLSVARVAELVIEALGLDPRSVALRFTAGAGDGGGWHGDTPLVDLDTTALRTLGWRAGTSPEEAVRRAAQETYERLRRHSRPLLLASERRAAAAAAGLGGASCPPGAGHP